ncbi:MAG TPA: cupredoxin domain-containing protein [Herpetosiphonaceae bacterium]
MSTPIVGRLLIGVAMIALVALGLAATVVRAAPVAQTGVVIEMRDNTFEPKTVTVPVGASVTWRNTGQRPHTAKADNGSFDTGNVASGATSSAVTFSAAGTFAYYCEYHGGPNGAGMSGTIVVAAAQASPSPSPAPSASPSPAPSAPPAGGVTPSITVRNQPISNSMITIERVVAAEDGWVAVHKFGPDGKMMLTPLAGLAAIKAGTTNNLMVKLDETFNAGDKLAPMLHIDAGTKGQYEFPNGPDVPVQANGQVVVREFTVEAAGGGARPPARLPDTGNTGTTSAPLGLVAVLTLLAGLSIIRSVRRRTSVR